MSAPTPHSEAAGTISPQPSPHNTLQQQNHPQQLQPERIQEWSQVTYMRDGMFRGRWMSFCMEVSQEPAVGRRKTEKDRRSIAPTPIVRLWIREHEQGGTGPGVLVDPGEVEVGDIVCAADLMPPRGVTHRPPREPVNPRGDTASPRSDSRRRSLSPQGGRSSGRGSSMSPRRNREHDRQTGEGNSSAEEDELAGSTPRPTSQGSEISARGARTLHRLRSEPEDEAPARRQTPVSVRNMYGNLHVAGMRLVAMEGGFGLWFLFTELSIRHEGRYSLRFRCFDLTAVSDRGPTPPLCQCHSADFQVYAPRNFPGLPKPTALAEHFARQGYKLNTRKNERQAASPQGTPRPSSSSRRPGSSHDS